jgi:hypothetical protein
MRLQVVSSVVVRKILTFGEYENAAQGSKDTCLLSRRKEQYHTWSGMTNITK